MAKLRKILIILNNLHDRVGVFKQLLHLAYKAPLKKWQARSTDEKQLVKETKERIQKSFREEMGLLVDIPKVGFGNSNDGNTSRIFFNDPESYSRITGIDISLIKRFNTILEVLSSGFNIDHEKFDSFAQTTAKMYVELYRWHPMSPTVHKILMHGAEVIEHAILPIVQISKARNNHLRNYRIDFAWKFSRIDCNRDVLNRLLLTSDPLISCSRNKRAKKSKSFSKEAMEILISSAQYDSSDEANEDLKENTESDSM